MLCMPRDVETVAADVREMRRAIAVEKGDAERWDLKYAAGGLIDIEFIAQFLQLVHAAEVPDILDTATAAVLDNAVRLGLLATEDAEALRPAVRLYQDLSQILRLALTAPFDPKTVSPKSCDAPRPRRGRAGFRDARGSPRRDAGARAPQLRAHPWRGAVSAMSRLARAPSWPRAGGATVPRCRG